MIESVKNCFKSNDEEEAEAAAFDAAENCSVLCDLYVIVKNAVVTTERIEILIWIVGIACGVVEATPSKVTAAVTA